MGSDPSADKENVQQAGRKAPVRKALFTGHQNPVGVEHLPPPPVSQHTSTDVGGPVFNMPSSDGAAAVAQSLAGTPAQALGHDTVDFSSVFDFL